VTLSQNNHKKYTRVLTLPWDAWYIHWHGCKRDLPVFTWSGPKDKQTVHGMSTACGPDTKKIIDDHMVRLIIEEKFNW